MCLFVVTPCILEESAITSRYALLVDHTLHTPHTTQHYTLHPIHATRHTPHYTQHKHNHQGLQGAVVTADMDGRALSTTGKRELRCLARESGLDKTCRRRLYAAIEDLKGGVAGADGEWIALNSGEEDG